MYSIFDNNEGTMNKKYSDIKPFFEPRSIAVIGATSKEGTLGKTIMRNLIEFEFTGKVFPVNPKYDSVQSIMCYSSVSQIEDEIDLAVIIINKNAALKIAEECGKKGVKALIVLSAGFREVGFNGKKLEEKLMKTIKKYNMRMVGPNCMGIINTDPKFSMNATFAPELPISGKVGFLSQSGALGVAIIGASKQYGIGLSTFISVGNKADISGNDILEYWENDPNTDVIL